MAPRDEAGRLWLHQLQLTVTDFVKEIHDTHHPLGGEFYYEDAKPEAKRFTENFLAERAPKYLGYFETVLKASGGPNVLGRKFSYMDLSLFQLDRGLALRFPQGDEAHRAKDVRASSPSTTASRSARASRHISQSPRRIAFNEDGIFRHYPELDKRVNHVLAQPAARVAA